MKKNKHIQKSASFLLWISFLGLCIFICIPWIEGQMIPVDMKQMMEEKDINPAHLFYSESAVSSEVIFDLVEKSKGQKENSQKSK